MKKVLFTILSAALCQTAFAKGIQVSDAYAYPTVGSMNAGGVFLSLTNTDARADKLIGASVADTLAEKVEIHTHINDNGVMRMRELKGGLTLPAGKTQELKRGSYHIMLMGLKKPLSVGDTFPVILKYHRNKAQTVTVTVREQQYKANAAHSHEHHHDHHHGHHHEHNHHQH
ncbi:copper chaperone PCu(A)C [Wielerella bovis]|uniref:copper chaperone PCu(A)C n=1 Tax=Wielerella bovis TaxID=2917790 RepID=UPI002018A429|nr:copper chaperone PCu(A)C [Wielerella bovis]MCG7657013.1 copper chaperone PCu(A)C [Wielerella bovis]MCG7659236.1 copper chaperone PCu(A)C [Wielerella bovis]